MSDNSNSTSSGGRSTAAATATTTAAAAAAAQVTKTTTTTTTTTTTDQSGTKAASTTKAAATVMRVARVDAVGTAQAIRIVDNVPIPTAQPGTVIVQNKVVGINFIDTYHRSGLYPVALPYVLGREGCGIVTALGDGAAAAGLHIGDRVAYAPVPGAYAEYTQVPLAKCAPVPDAVSNEDAASVMLQGLTAHYLCHDCHAVRAGETVLVHAAAGGTGRLLVQLCTKLGATVIGTTSSATKAAIAKEAGAKHMINYVETPEWASIVRDMTNGRGVDAVFDGVGKATFQQGLDALKTTGTMVTFGNAGGHGG